MRELILGTRPGCTNCDWASTNAKVQRYFNLHERRWQYYRACKWCGNCYAATEQEYQEQEGVK